MMPDPRAAAITERVVFSGRVQGVGFRYTARSLAKRHPVTGFVRNLRDGTVELVAQGAPAAVNRLIADVMERFGEAIQNVERQPHPVHEAFDSFDIRA